MSQGTELTGMVLSSMASEDYNKRVVLLTKERGKITAFARGARRQGSMLMAASEPFSFGTFTLYEGKTAYTLVSARISNYFEAIRKDFEKTCYACYFMELAEYYGRENLDASMMLNLLYAALRALEKNQMEHTLIRAVFEIKIMVINGEFPQDIVLDERLSETARYAFQFCIETPIQRLFSFTVAQEICREMEMALSGIRNRTIDRRMKSLDVLEMMNS